MTSPVSPKIRESRLKEARRVVRMHACDVLGLRTAAITVPVKGKQLSQYYSLLAGGEVVRVALAEAPDLSADEPPLPALAFVCVPAEVGHMAAWAWRKLDGRGPDDPPIQSFQRGTVYITERAQHLQDGTPSAVKPVQLLKERKVRSVRMCDEARAVWQAAAQIQGVGMGLLLEEAVLLLGPVFGVKPSRVTEAAKAWVRLRHRGNVRPSDQLRMWATGAVATLEPGVVALLTDEERTALGVEGC